MSIAETKNRVFVVAIYGGGDNSLPEAAERVGRLIAEKTNWIVFTGASWPDRRSSAVKHRALVGPHDLGRPWMGLPQAKDQLSDTPDPKGFVFKTPLGHKRNYLEALLCDGAFAFPGGSGTLSEAVATLCLGKPVILIGDQQWSGVGPGPDGRLTAERKARWIKETHKKFASEPTMPAIDALIERDITVENLNDVERRLGVMSETELQGALDKLAGLLGTR